MTDSESEKKRVKKRAVRNESMGLADLELWQAVHQGSLAGVRAALAAGADPGSVSDRGEGVLARAARMLAPGEAGALRERESCLVELIEAGADVESSDARGRSALSLAAGYGSIVAVRRLLDAGASVNAACERGFNALHWAAQDGTEQIALELMARGAEIEAKNNAGESAVWIAAAYAKRGILEALLRAGADVESALSPRPPEWSAKIRRMIGAARERGAISEGLSGEPAASARKSL